jgi:hypothetical protein
MCYSFILSRAPISVDIVNYNYISLPLKIRTQIQDNVLFRRSSMAPRSVRFGVQSRKLSNLVGH